MDINPRRLSILTNQEIDDLFGFPKFNDEDRHQYFDLSAAERDTVARVRTWSVSIYLIMQLGYFKAKRQFFVCKNNFVLDDLQYIIHRYFPGKDVESFKMPSPPKRRQQHQSILTLCGYRLCDRIEKKKIEYKVQRIAMLSTQPIYILREVLQYLTHQHLVVPGYSFLQELIGRAVAGERKRIIYLLEKALQPEVKQKLDALIQSDEQLFRINTLKHEPKDFSYKELHQEIERQIFFKPLYEFAEKFLVTSGISNESMKYYASLVKFYRVYKLQRMNSATTRLYLLCFSFYRFCQISDNLIEAFIHLVNQYEQQAKLVAGETMHAAHTDAASNLQAAGKVLGLFFDTSIPGDVPFAVVKKKAFSLLQPERFQLVSDYMCNLAFDKAGFEWSQYSRLSAKFKRNLRHIFSSLEFSSRIEADPLLEAVKFLQALLQQGKSPRQTDPMTFPVKVIPKSLQRYLFVSLENKEKRLDVDRYEFLTYRLLRNSLEAGDVFVQNSTEFRQFEDDLICDARWQHKDELLQEIGAPILLEPIQKILDGLRNELEESFKTVNQRIATGSNKQIKIGLQGGKRLWKFVYPSLEESVKNSFYSHLPSVSIADLLWFVAESTGFLDAFKHVLDRYVKHEPDPKEILACIVAMGTNMGLGKMAEVSGLNHASLRSTANNFMRQETLNMANDAVSNATSTLPAFRFYDIRDEIHSSSDGQRIETQINTINARYSPKYFGLKKGVSSCTLVANHVPINTKIIGAHEHESHYVFDLLFNNTSEIKPGKHSTDTHGINQVNFWTLFVFGYYFAPRYRDLYKKTDSLVGFNHPSQYSNFLIKPSRKASEELIVMEWPNVQRIMASLAQKYVTQSTIIRKLSSYSRRNQTKKALWELDNICRTLYILKYIDDPLLQQSVQKALNRGEAYNRLRSVIAYVNAGKFRVQNESEQQIWSDCSRLIANSIIFYNTALLSKVYEQKQISGNHDAMKAITGISPIAWQHINLFGTFEFNQSNLKLDIKTFADYYEDPAFWKSAINENEDETFS